MKFEELSNQEKRKMYYKQMEEISGCCSSYEYALENVDGICPDCGRLTSGGEAICGCHHGTEVCKTCHATPCQGSC